MIYKKDFHFYIARQQPAVGRDHRHLDWVTPRIIAKENPWSQDRGGYLGMESEALATAVNLAHKGLEWIEVSLVKYGVLLDSYTVEVFLY